MSTRAIFVVVALVSGACGGGDEPGDEPGLETGPCLSGRQCAAGLVCASEVCVDLGGSGDDGASNTPSPGDEPMAATDGVDAGGGAMDGGDGGDDAGPDADADAGDAADAGDGSDPPADGGGNEDGGPASWCPVPPSSLSCATTCDLFQFECYECPNEPGDLCTYYDNQYEACLSSCEYVKTMPDDFTYEAFACRQYAGNDCGDAHVDCLLQIDCSGA